MESREREMCEFDRRFDRQNTHDLKWRREGVEAYLSHPLREDMIPMWIADTDFGCMRGIVDTVKARAEHEIYGYCAPGEDFYRGIGFWEKARFQWDIQPQCDCICSNVTAKENAGIVETVCILYQQWKMKGDLHHWHHPCRNIGSDASGNYVSGTDLRKLLYPWHCSCICNDSS